MRKCRFYPECARCDEVGDDWFPCDGTDEGTTCEYFKPMPDVIALFALARELEHETGSVCGMCMGKTARRIREALGEEQ